MYLKLRNVVGGVLLVVVAAGTWYLSRPAAEAPRARSTASAPPAGYYLLGARLVGTDDTGRIAYRISAARAEELPEEDGLGLFDVRVEYSADETVPWLLSAAEAVAAKDGSFVDLRGGVRLESLPAENRRKVVIETERLRLEPEHFIARSADPVQVMIGRSTVSAVGIEAHLKDDLLQLESDVNGRLAP